MCVCEWACTCVYVSGRVCVSACESVCMCALHGTKFDEEMCTHAVSQLLLQTYMQLDACVFVCVIVCVRACVCV